MFIVGVQPVKGQSAGQGSLGIEVLHQVSDSSSYTLLPSQVRPLFTDQELESFFKELEGEVPHWNILYDKPDEEMGTRLFDFNRSQDRAREGHPLLSQPIGYLWSGILRKYDPDYKGYTVAMGPDFTETAWGVIRFKPVGLPQEMIAIPSGEIRGWVEHQFEQGKKVEVKILFSGTLIQDESLIYAFSHEDPNQGMIIPVVRTENIQYFLQLNE